MIQSSNDIIQLVRWLLSTEIFYNAPMIIIQSSSNDKKAPVQIQTLAKVVLWKMLQIAESNLTKVRRDEENNESEGRKGKIFILKINNWGERYNNYFKTNYWICSTKVRLGSFLLLFVIRFLGWWYLILRLSNYLII